MRKLGLFILGAATLMSGCGKDATSVSSTLGALSAALGTLVVSSPTAQSSATTASGLRDRRLRAQLLLDRLLWSMLENSVTEVLAGAPSPTDLPPLGDLKKEFGDALKNGGTFDPTAQAAKITFAKPTFGAECFGPGLEVKYLVADGASHPVNQIKDLPPGDLGIFAERELPDNTTGEACAAAQINVLVGYDRTNMAMKFLQAALGAGGKTGKSLPDVGASVDILADVPAPPGFVIKGATITRQTDSADGKVYKTQIDFTQTGKTGTRTGYITVFNTPLNSDNTENKGRLQAVFLQPDKQGGDALRGTTSIYQYKNSTETVLTESCLNQGTVSSDFFKANGRIDFTKAACGQDLVRFLASFDTANSVGTLYYAWQAGAGDSSTRGFAATVSKSGSTESGVGYFAFGPAMKDITDAMDTVTELLTKFYPDWTTFSAAPLLAKMQGQSFSRSGPGKFTPTTSNYRFVPTSTGAGSVEIDPTDTTGNPEGNQDHPNYSTVTRTVSGSPDFLDNTSTTLGAVPQVTVPTF